MLDLMKGGELWKNMIEPPKKGYELSVVNGGKQQGLFLQIPSWCPSVFRDKGDPFLRV